MMALITNTLSLHKDDIDIQVNSYDDNMLKINLLTMVIDNDTRKHMTHELGLQISRDQCEDLIKKLQEGMNHSG